MYDYLIVGAGLFGSIFAYEANKSGKKVLVIEKRNHIGGNCYTENYEDYHIHTYGPHIFHTSQKYIWDYINQFTEFNNYSHRVKSFSQGKLYSMPINLLTLHQIWPEIITPEDAKKKIESENGSLIFEMREIVDFAIPQISPRINLGYKILKKNNQILF